MGEVETPEAAVIGDKVKLSFRDQCMEIAVRDIQVVRPEYNADRVDVRLEHEGRFSVVSGLQDGEASRFIEAVERQRLGWWTAVLAGELESLSQVHERLRGFSDPVSYVRLDGMRDLVADAKDALMGFMRCWPEWIPNASHIDVVDALLGFLEDLEQARARANEAFIAAELERCRDLFDRIEARPLSEEQRRAVVVDERRDLVVAAAGSGKTSVIVAKTAWLVRRGYRKPSELLLLAFARGARKEMQERLEKRLGVDTRGARRPRAPRAPRHRRRRPDPRRRRGARQYPVHEGDFPWHSD